MDRASMDRPRVSVVMATYDGERFVRAQLESIKAQSHPPEELVVGDDGSTDGTLEIIEHFAGTAPFPVTVVRHDRVGYPTNFLLSLEKAVGDLIAFADQDDVWLPDKLERMLSAMRRYDADLVLHAVKTVDAALRPARTGYRNASRILVFDRWQANVWFQGMGNVMLLRRSVLDRCDWRTMPMSQWPGQPLTHDNFVKLLTSVRGRMVRLPDRLVLYRQHGGNSSDGAPFTLLAGPRHFGGRAMHVESLRHRAAAAKDWGRYFPDLVEPEHRARTAAYFDRAAEAMSERADRLEAGGRKGLESLSKAVVRGEYATHTPSGFGWRAFLQDLFHLSYLGAFRSC